MSDAVSQYGFTAARRGYAPEQVDRTLSALTAQRDESWERLSVLGAGLREMEKRLAEFVEAAADAPEPDYALLSEQAAGLAVSADNEARAVREAAERFAEDTRDEVYEAGQALARAAKEYATAVRAEADQATRRSEERTRAEAEKLRGEADREARGVRDAATAYAAGVRVAAAEASERAEARLAELRRSADEAFAAAVAEEEAKDAAVAVTAERRLKEAEQYRETVIGQVKQSDAEAQAKADQLIDKARREAQAINAASEKEQAESAARHEVVQQHLDHIKGTLASLTGAAVGAIEPDQTPVDAKPAAIAPPVDPDADTGEIAVVADAVPAHAVPGDAVAGDADVAPSDATTVLRITVPAAPGPAPVPDFVPGPVSAAPPAPVPPAPAPAVPPVPAPGAPPRPAAAPEQAAAPPEVETRIIPKIVIVDDGSDYATPHTVHRRT
ncbi:hypothetical protein [Kitasatospora sp. NPDC057223]|uniref:hypothetical protein n=1 Tax=Kitasatospora sp. NPDC057223 TaxID=3346055 RepID=UPI003624D388